MVFDTFRVGVTTTIAKIRTFSSIQKETLKHSDSHFLPFPLQKYTIPAALGKH